MVNILPDLDEIDSIFAKGRPPIDGSSSAEREQVVNTLLASLDGIASNEGIIIIAATSNCVDVLDEALRLPR